MLALGDLHGTHPTASEIYGAIRVRNFQIGLATVYRTLDAMVERGDVAAVRTGNAVRYDLTHHHHHHLHNFHPDIFLGAAQNHDLAVPMVYIILQNQYQAYLPYFCPGEWHTLWIAISVERHFHHLGKECVNQQVAVLGFHPTPWHGVENRLEWAEMLFEAV